MVISGKELTTLTLPYKGIPLYVHEEMFEALAQFTFVVTTKKEPKV